MHRDARCSYKCNRLLKPIAAIVTATFTTAIKPAAVQSWLYHTYATRKLHAIANIINREMPHSRNGLEQERTAVQ